MSKDRFAEILNYLSAMSRDIGQFRSETNNRLARLESRMDGFESRMGQLETKVDTGFAEVRKDIRLLGRQVEVMTKDLMQVRGQQLDHEARLDALEAK